MIKKISPQSPTVLDLSGPDGNAFVLLGLARSQAIRAGQDPTPILEDMMSSDYAHLVRTFHRHFGEAFVLLAPEGTNI